MGKGNCLEDPQESIRDSTVAWQVRVSESGKDRTAAPRPAATPPVMRHRTATHPFGGMRKCNFGNLNAPPTTMLHLTYQ